MFDSGAKVTADVQICQLGTFGLSKRNRLVMTPIARRAATGLVYGLLPADPLALAATLVVLWAIGLIAAYVPARRAAAIDPVSAISRA